MTALSTRLLKAQCGTCAYTVRVTRRWLAELGAPLCPCNSERMECAEYEALLEAQRETERGMMDAYARSITVDARVLRERWLHGRVIHTCLQCKNEIPIGEEYHLRVLRVGGEMLTEKRCLGCKLRQTPESRLTA